MRATAMSTDGATAKESGSRGLVSNSRVSRNRLSANAAAIPTRAPASVDAERLSGEHRGDSRWLSTERYSYADFARSFRHRIAEHAIDADRCKQQRKTGERRQQRRAESLARNGLVEYLFHGGNLRDGRSRIQRVDDALHRKRHGFRRCRR